MGRELELAAIEHAFRAETRVVSLVGPAGVGKTRLAVEHAQRADIEGDLVTAVVRASGLLDAALMVDEVIAALPGPQGLAVSAAEALWERCHGDDLLLVLDDVETAVDAGSLVDELVAGYPGLRVLATGLRPLGAEGEQVVRVAPFDTEAPLDGDDLPPGVLVFAQKAVAVDAGFALGEHNRDDVLAICHEVGGLPLAIELAASRTPAIPVSVMARQLAGTQGIGLLRDGSRRRTDRHASMEQTLDWTCALLSDDAGALLDQLSVFEGRFDLEAALRVTVPEASDTAEMLDRLSALVDVQLLDLDARDADHPRFAMPRLVRSHAARRLTRSGRSTETERRHAHYFQARCRRPVGADLLPDILAARDRAVVDGSVDDALHAAVEATASQRGTTQVLQHRVDELVARLDEESSDPVLLARALIRSATGSERVVEGTTYAEWTTGRVRGAVAAARRSGDQQALLEALVLTVRSLPTTMDAPSAFAAAAEGLELARDLGNEAMTAQFEMYAAMGAQVRQDAENTALFGYAGLRRAREVGDLYTATHTALLLHRLPAHLRDPDVALPSLEELLEACERQGDGRLGGSVLAALAEQALADGDDDAAARWAYRLQRVAADWRLTEPLAATIPIVTLVVLAARRGDVRVGTVLHAALGKFESVLAFALQPDALLRYQEAGGTLAALASAGEGPHALAAWRAEGEALSLVEAHDRGVAYARTLLRGGRTSPREAAEASPASEPASVPASMTGLTPRETKVLQEMVSGATNREIGERLGVSAKTVMHHSVAIYRKLGVRGRAEATAYAVRAGLAAS